MKFKELSITFHTDQIKECIAFYCKYFNAKVTFDCGWYAVINLENENITPMQLSFQSSVEGMERASFSGRITINLLTADVDASYKQLEKEGVSFVEKITDHEWGDRAFSLKDPIGNIVYIYSEREVGEEYKSALK